MRLILLKVTCVFCLFIAGLGASAQTKIKVACIGNSITAGSINDTKEFEPYPTRLQVLLQNFKPDTYEVRNFGVSGRTVLKKTPESYWNESKYRDVLAWKPDIVIIKFGTNDSKDKYWPIYKQDFYNDYMAFVNSLKVLDSHPIIYVCYPLAAFSNYAQINDKVIREEIVPQVKKVALKSNATFIDLYTAFTGKRALIKDDGIHPLQPGAEFLANEIYQVITK